MRQAKELPVEWKLLAVLREALNPVVPFKGSTPRIICYYFRRAEPGQITGQYHPKHRVELCAITREGVDEMGKEVARENHVFDTEEKVAEHIRLAGHIAPDDVVVDEHTTFPYFAYLNFFNNVVPRPAWLDEKIREGI